MNNAALIRTLIIYAVCVPLAVFVGYQLTDPLTYSTFGLVGLFLLVLVFPLLLRWHHFLLIASWNMTAVMFFIPGNPHLWLVVVALSLGVSVLHRAMDRRVRFISVPQLTWPLVCLAITALVTAKFAGGIGIRTLGGDVYGGKRYIYLIGAILGYFALTTQQIPRERARFYISVFLLGGLTGIVGDFFMLASPQLSFVFWMFPPNMYTYQSGYVELGTSRLAGMKGVSTALYCFMLVRYGIRGIFSIQTPWRAIALVFVVAIGLLGGFRSMVIIFAMVFIIQFFLEGLHKTKLVLPMALSTLLMAVTIVAIAPALPVTFQRALSFLPLQGLDARATEDAQGSAEWRLRIWKTMLPKIPEHLLMGTGYVLSRKDYGFLFSTSEAATLEEDWASAVVGDYHNGPLDVVMTFGIWGVITFVWFLVASIGVLIANYRYGPQEFRIINIFLLAAFIAKTILFLVIFGGLHSDMLIFVGYVGLSVSLNGGVCRPTTAPNTQSTEEMPTRIRRAQRPVFQH